MRARRAAELTHALRGALGATLADRRRRSQYLRHQLDAFDLGRRLAGIRTRLVAEDGRLAAAIGDRRHRADARFRDCASRLETLSPLAVLARGYAVCWSADGSRIVRAPDDVDIGATGTRYACKRRPGLRGAFEAPTIVKSALPGSYAASTS